MPINRNQLANLLMLKLRFYCEEKRVPQEAKVEAPSMPNQQNPPHLGRNPGWTSRCPLLCFRASRKKPRIPQDNEVTLPIMRNDKLVYQKCQDPLATLPGICNARTMSNGRGPAAEGVAHTMARKCKRKQKKAE